MKTWVVNEVLCKFSTRVAAILPEAFNKFSLSRWLQVMLSSLYIHVLSISKNYVIAFDAI